MGNEQNGQNEQNGLKKIVIATRNMGKLQEFKGLLEPLGYQIVSLADYPDLPDVVEDRDTFLGNALKKAQEIAEQLHVPVLADDSGLEVAALHGQPGVYSARYAGEPANDAANNAKLLSELQASVEELPEAKPPAGDGQGKQPAYFSKGQFVSVLVLYDPAKGTYLHTEGTVSGLILTEPRGENGFGYDPLFYVPEFGKSMAELTLAEKNSISHRGNALKKLAELL